MTLSLLISRLLDPMWVVPAITALGAYRSGLVGEALSRFLLIFAVCMVGIPLVLRLLYRPSGWDISDRTHRPKAFMILLLLGLIYIILARIFGNTKLVSLLILYELWMAGFLVISLFWKISGHAGGIALAVGLLIAWYGWAWWPILLFVPLVGWARVVSKNHTVTQVIAGALYSWVLLIGYETWTSIF